jgi:hypothetical protein
MKKIDTLDELFIHLDKYPEDRKGIVMLTGYGELNIQDWYTDEHIDFNIKHFKEKIKNI